MKKIYLAIPYGGIEEESYKLATTFTAFIMSRHKDINIFSPITHSHPLTKIEGINMPNNFEFWKEKDFQFIDWANEVWVLVPDGNVILVNKSAGVAQEIMYANKLKKPIIYKHFTI